jgi:hypothetical protein
MESVHSSKESALPAKVERFGDKVDHLENRLNNRYSTASSTQTIVITGVPTH